MSATSDARKRLAEATDPHGGCKVGTCKAEDQWRTVSCAGGGGDVEAAWETFDRATPAVFWDVATWVRGGNYITGSLDVADRKRIGLALLAAQPAAPQPTEGAAEVVCTNCEADDLGCTACGAHGTLAARSQRPEGVTVTEWKVDHRNNGCWPFEDVYANESTARFAANGRPILSRQRTTFPDVVTEWAEVSGDTEAGGDRG